jgi:hypothetical protein
MQLYPKEIICARFSAIASKYDELIHNTETKFGILSLREELVSRARGRVLEVRSPSLPLCLSICLSTPESILSP